MGIGDLISGERGRPADLAAALVTGIALGALVILRAPAIDWQSVVLTLLAADIGAGLISNATEATRESWRKKASAQARAAFIAIHVTIYPAAVLWLSRGDWELGAILVTILIAKVLLFWSGQRPRA